MAVIAGPAWALIHCILAQAVTVTAADRTEIRTRVQSSALRFDAETRPAVRLALTTPHASYSFGYVPTLTWLSMTVDEEGELIFQQAADASAGYRWEHTSVSITQSGSYGTRNFRAMSVAAPALDAPTGTTPPGGTTGTPPPGGTGTPPPGGQTGTPPPGQTGPLTTARLQSYDQNVTLASSNTRATLQQIFSTRTFGTLSAGYEYGGGIGAQSEGFLPLRKGPSATISVRHRASLTDDLTTVTNGTSLETGSTMRAQMVDLGEQWYHRWAPALVSSLYVGAAAALAESDGPPRRRTSAIVPTSTAALDYGFGLSGGRLRSVGLLQFAPMIDRFTGDFDQRLQWVLDVSWTRYQLSLIANFSGAQSALPRVVFSNSTALPFNYYSGSASVLYRFTRQVSAEGGLRAAWVRTEGVEQYPLLWSVFVAGSYALSATYL
ncbi:MAG TPA: hypothetical protein VK550_33630 [Polyangiaceae bacterium]|nr:hypothetical protein [Polyangiaceae bacterium]